LWGIGSDKEDKGKEYSIPNIQYMKPETYKCNLLTGPFIKTNFFLGGDSFKKKNLSIGAYHFYNPFHLAGQSL